MEHMPRPARATASDADSVPYVCREVFLHDPYDGGSFLDYPERVRDAWPKSVVASIEARKAAGTLSHRPQPAGPRIEPFVQTWLFFGLLREFLGPAYRAEDFIQEVTDREAGFEVRHRSASSPPPPPAGLARDRITTAKLIPLVQDWMAKAKEPGGLSREAALHLLACLNQAWTVLRGICDALRPSVKLNIGSVIDLLSDAMKVSLPGRRPLTHPVWLYDRHLLRRQLLASGWCPTQLSTFGFEGWGSVQAWHYLSHLDVRAPTRDHRRCSDTRCEILRNGVGRFAIHTAECDRTCRAVTVRGEHLTDMLAGGKLPVLHILDSGDGVAPVVRLEEQAARRPYVAISHIWGDGLGNPHANSLPGCQVSRIGRLVQNLNQLLSEEETDTLVWIDTLLCPSDAYPEGKTAALSRMKETYQDARAVLILDTGLEAIDSRDMNSLEICARVVTSGSTSRLWCLQEAALARSLWAQFRDRARSVDAFSTDTSLPHRYDLHTWIAAEITGAVWSLRPGILYANKALQTPGRVLRMILEGVRRRSVSFESDEPICLAALFGLPIREIAELPAEERMPRFWSLLSSGGIVQWVIFLDRPKLVRPGFRWAPRTFFLHDRSDADFELVAPVAGARYGELCPRGLRVHYPGGVFDVPRIPWPPGDWFWLDEDAFVMAHLRSDLGRWYSLFTKPGEPDAIPHLSAHFTPTGPNRPSAPMAVLWHPQLDPSERSPSATALLAAYEGVEDDARPASHPVHHVRILHYVNIKLLDAASALLHEKAHRAALALRQDPFASQLLASARDDGRLPSANTEAVAALRAKMARAAEEVNVELGLTGHVLTKEDTTRSKQTYKSVERSFGGYVGRMSAEFLEPSRWCVD